MKSVLELRHSVLLKAENIDAALNVYMEDYRRSRRVDHSAFNWCVTSTNRVGTEILCQMNIMKNDAHNYSGNFKLLLTRLHDHYKIEHFA